MRKLITNNITVETLPVVTISEIANEEVRQVLEAINEFGGYIDGHGKGDTKWPHQHLGYILYHEVDPNDEVSTVTRVCPLHETCTLNAISIVNGRPVMSRWATSGNVYNGKASGFAQMQRIIL